jgi:hypothetical protein
MKWSAERDDLWLMPYLTPPDKSALQHAGINTVRALAMLKEPRQAETPESAADAGDLVPAPGKEALVRKLATTRSVGPRLDELVHRARRYRRWKGDALAALSYITSKRSPTRSSGRPCGVVPATVQLWRGHGMAGTSRSGAIKAISRQPSARR